MSKLGTVLITAKSVANAEAALQMLRDAGCELRVETTPTPIDEAWLLDKTRAVDGLIFAMEPVSARLLDNATRLKVIARPGVGYDTVDMAAATRKGVVVTVAAGTNHESVADFTFGLLLAASRGIVPAANGVAAGGWERVTGSEAWGKTLAIVGMGRIGRSVARRARGFEMRVLAVGRESGPALPCGPCEPHEADVEFVALDDALREADFVSLHAPLTEATANLINARTLALMKRGAYLVNTSRGGLVDEAALAAAVRSGHLAGAAVDVLCVQGAKSPSPLIGVPGIVVTPHMATFSREAMERVARSAAASVIAVLQGRRPEHVINPEVFGAR